MELAEWNERLSGQFAEVRRSRQARATELPLFALEHGLNQTEIQDLSTAIRAHVQHTPPTPKHELAWIVYAAEIGYRYSGDQYWQTFEAETPGWAIRADRKHLEIVLFHFIAHQRTKYTTGRGGPRIRLPSYISLQRTAIKFAAGTFERIAAVLAEGEDRMAFMREAVEREIERRERAEERRGRKRAVCIGSLVRRS